jgi:hypothetical protein
MDTRPRAPVLNIIRDEVTREGGRDIASPHEPIPPPLTLRSGREGHRAFRENDQHTEHYTPH